MEEPEVQTLVLAVEQPELEAWSNGIILSGLSAARREPGTRLEGGE